MAARWEEPPEWAAWKAEAQAGNAEAMYKLGCGWEHLEQRLPWKGAERKTARAASIHWYTEAAEHGHIQAMKTVAMLWQNDYITDPAVERLEGAAKWYRRAAELGDANAIYETGKRVLYGQGVECDYAEAVRWLRKADELGVRAATLALAEMYEDGEGVPRDLEEARRLYLRAEGLDTADDGEAPEEGELGLVVRAALRRIDNFDATELEAARYRKRVLWYAPAAFGGLGLRWTLTICLARLQTREACPTGRSVSRKPTESLARKRSPQGCEPTRTWKNCGMHALATVPIAPLERNADCQTPVD